MIPPGRSVRFGFLVRSPRVGSVRKELKIFAGDEREPLALFNPSVRTIVVAPYVAHHPDSVSISLVRGLHDQHDFSVTVIENAAGERHFIGIDTDDTAPVTAEIANVLDRPAMDPETIERTYIFRLTPTADLGAASTLRTLLKLRTRDPGDALSIPFDLRVVSALALLPRTLECTLTADRPSEESVIRIIRRRGADVPIRVGEYDEKLLDVAPVVEEDGTVASYVVRAKGAPGLEGKTQIVFNVGTDDAETIHYPVHVVAAATK